MSMAINFGRAGKCNKDFSFIKSLDPLITWFCKAT